MNDKPKFVRLDLEPFSMILKSMTDEQIAGAMRAVLEYCESGRVNEPSKGDVSSLAFNILKSGVDEGWALWETNKARNQKMQEAKANKQSSRHRDDIVTTSSRQQIINNKEESIKDKEEIIKDKIKEVDKSTLLSADNETERIDYNGLMNFWNLSLGKYNSTLPQIEKMTDARKKSVKRLIREYGKETFWKVLSSAMQSEFLNSGQFKCGFDWVTKPSNFIKILEGNYETKQQQGEERLVKIMNGLFK